MRRSTALRTLILAGAAFSVAAIPIRAQDADDLKRGVARVSLINGDVSVRRGDSGDWVAAAVNAPLVAQDRVSTGPSSRTEIQLDSSNFIRLGANAEVNLAELEYHRFVLQLARGTATFRVIRDSDTDAAVDTPNVSVRPSKRGVYRITVHDDGQTDVTVRQGEVEVFTPRGSQHLKAGQTMMARGTASDPEFQMVSAIGYDDWDRWNEDRDRMLERSGSYRYVSRDIYGAEDLDPYGSWVYEAPYGYVWRPVVSVGWAPYRVGRWVWLDWYGWTWVSGDPWGWAPYHYGRWFYASGGWCWYPGGIGVRHYWSPALVAFFGFGHGVGVGVGIGGGWGNVGWVPLAPHERFSPWWGRSYYGGYRNSTYIDRSVNITNVNITNVYRNARVNNGVTAVNAGDFSHGRFGNVARVNEGDLRQASLVRGAVPAAPGDAHLRYSDRTVSNVPRGAENTRFFSRRQPDQVQRVSFSDQRQALERISRVPVAERSSVSGVTASPMGRRDSAAAPVAAQSPGAGSVRTNDGGNRGWRRMNEGNSQPAGANAAPAAQPPAARSNDGGSRGWRRFGENPGQGGASSAPAAQAPAASPAPRNNDGGNRGWRRFGDNSGQGSSPAPAASPAPRNENAAPRNDGGGSNWRRFGEPSSTPAPSASPRSERPSSDSGSRGWNRFGDPGSSRNSGSRAETPSPAPAPNPQRYQRQEQSAPRYSAPRQESIHIAPPVVRERSSAPAARSERPSGGGGGGERSSGGGHSSSRGGEGGSRGGGRGR